MKQLVGRLFLSGLINLFAAGLQALCPPLAVEPSEDSDCIINPLTPTVAIMGTAIKRPVPDQVKPSFVIFDIRAL